MSVRTIWTVKGLKPVECYREFCAEPEEEAAQEAVELEGGG